MSPAKLKGSKSSISRLNGVRGYKKMFGRSKRRVWSKIKRNIKFKTMLTYPISYVGKRLVRRLKRRLFKKKKLF